MIAFGDEAMWNMRQDAALSPNALMRFFLNVRTNNTLLVDEKGGEFPDLSAACRHAMRIALEVARRYPRRPGGHFVSVPLALEVMDHKGALVFRTPIH
jgi:hypothetical protein